MLIGDEREQGAWAEIVLFFLFLFLFLSDLFAFLPKGLS